MAIKGYEKWDDYAIGSVRFINRTKNHGHRQIFVDSVNNMRSILEIGPGEMIEYAAIRDANPDIKYSVMDVSDLFLDHCKFTFPEVKTIKMKMEDISTDIGRYDMVYVSSVLEHSENIKVAIRNLMSIADNFHFVLFKWNYSGNLKSQYNKKKKYWSTSFNVNMLLEEISTHGTITSCDVISTDGSVADFSSFSKGREGECRTGDRLIIVGEL